MLLYQSVLSVNVADEANKVMTGGDYDKLVDEVDEVLYEMDFSGLILQKLKDKGIDCSHLSVEID